ncbi:MAG: hypothetical protein H3C35_03760 [Bacteroidetes bacterium]|nr:hypothetical protein [Bacteroidota bacterium]
MIFDVLGYIGFVSLAICWIPQTIDTIKQGKVLIKKSFLLLYAVGSTMLLLQAIGIDNLPLILLNGYTATASLINLYYGYFPRTQRIV